jgi:hypothetical protein
VLTIALEYGRVIYPESYLRSRPENTYLEIRVLSVPAMSHRKRLALELLADAGRCGSADPSFIARFTPELLDLVGKGLATVQRETMRNRGRTVEIARLRITDAGRRLIENQVHFTCH